MVNDVVICIVEPMQQEAVISIIRIFLKTVRFACDVSVSKTNNSAFSINNTPKKSDSYLPTKYLNKWKKTEYYDSSFRDG
ncbi:MAG: hypothetical protein WCL18_06440 [bacterium]